MKKEFLNAQEAASLLGFTVGTLYQYVHRRLIPFHKVANGRSIRFRREDLLNYLNGKRVEANV